jgi:hypothetical protein
VVHDLQSKTVFETTFFDMEFDEVAKCLVARLRGVNPAQQGLKHWFPDFTAIRPAMEYLKNGATES